MCGEADRANTGLQHRSSSPRAARLRCERDVAGAPTRSWLKIVVTPYACEVEQVEIPATTPALIGLVSGEYPFVPAQFDTSIGFVFAFPSDYLRQIAPQIKILMATVLVKPQHVV